MNVSRASRVSPGRFRPLFAALLAVLTLVVASGCGGDTTAAPKRPAPTPFSRLNATGAQVPRIEFCKELPAAAVKAAVGGAATKLTSYGNGDEEQLSDGATDVAHEIGCTWTAEDGNVARAWVFARPVDATLAETVIRAGAKTPGCTQSPAPTFGRPSVTQTCTLPPGPVGRVRHAGLFGQTWLTCEVSSPAPTSLPTVTRRADAWCVQVLDALNTGR